MARRKTSYNPAKTRPAIPAPPTKSPPASRLASNAPTLPPRSTAGRSLATLNTSFSTTLGRTAACGDTRTTTIAPNVLCLLQSGKKNLTVRKQSPGNLSSSGRPRLPVLPRQAPRLRPNLHSSPKRKVDERKFPYEDDDEPPCAHALCPPALGHLQCRMHYFSEPDSDDESMAIRDIIYEDSGDENIVADPLTLALPLPVPLPAPAPASPDLAVEVVDFVSSLTLRPASQTTRYDHDWHTLCSAPFRVLDRGPRLTSILFADGRPRLDTGKISKNYSKPLKQIRRLLSTIAVQKSFENER
jgi:hypothetical protein